VLDRRSDNDIHTYWVLTMKTQTMSHHIDAGAAQAATTSTAGNDLAQPLPITAAIVDADGYFAALQDPSATMQRHALAPHQARSFYWDAATLERAIRLWQKNVRQLSSDVIATDVMTAPAHLTHSDDSAAARLTVVWLADNSPDWIALDLACARLQAIAVPLPTYISAPQLLHVVQKLKASLQPGDRIVLLEQGMFTATGRSLLADLQHNMPREMAVLPAVNGFSTADTALEQSSEQDAAALSSAHRHAWHCFGIAGRSSTDHHAKPDSAAPHAVAHVVTHAVTHAASSSVTATGEAPACSVMATTVMASSVIAPTVIDTATQKITFTSGSTGQPKGVCLSAATQWQVAQSLIAAVSPWLQPREHAHETSPLPRHLCLLPLPTLLENIAGVYAPLFAGGEVWVASAPLRGFEGSRLTDPARLLRLISAVAPKSLILVPELLQFLVHACRQGWQAPSSLQFIAVGGARVAPDLLLMAQQCGLPVFQGYGLSECGSVVALSNYNALAANHLSKTADGQHLLDSVGKVLPHTQVEIRDGEIYVKSAFLGYLGDPAATQAAATDGWVATGDLGFVDADGYLFVQGRRKNLLISSFGRNIHPEWVEGELLKSGLIHQAMVVGDGQPYCAALIVVNPAVLSQLALASGVDAADETAQELLIQGWIDKVNQQLPDYAQVRRWHRVQLPFSTHDQTLTDNHRPRRAQIMMREQAALQRLYDEGSHAAQTLQGAAAAVELGQGSNNQFSNNQFSNNQGSNNTLSDILFTTSTQAQAMVLDTNFVSQEPQEV
jgi:long-subunit acyl-CoA synthetase (AMP-forming)